MPRRPGRAAMSWASRERREMPFLRTDTFLLDAGSANAGTIASGWAYDSHFARQGGGGFLCNSVSIRSSSLAALRLARLTARCNWTS